MIIICKEGSLVNMDNVFGVGVAESAHGREVEAYAPDVGHIWEMGTYGNEYIARTVLSSIVTAMRNGCSAFKMPYR